MRLFVGERTRLLKANRRYEIIFGARSGLLQANRRYEVVVGVLTGLLKAGSILEVVSIDDLLAAGEFPPHFAGKAWTDLLPRYL